MLCVFIMHLLFKYTVKVVCKLFIRYVTMFALTLKIRRSILCRLVLSCICPLGHGTIGFVEIADGWYTDLLLNNGEDSLLLHVFMSVYHFHSKKEKVTWKILKFKTIKSMMQGV